MSDNQILRRRAIEALRAGVPNRDAVSALGTSQKDIERRFLEQLDITRDLPRTASNPGGILIGGGFGSGKSHLLEHLQHLALERRFIVSKVVVSKETPLHDPAKMFRAAIETSIVSEHQGNALKEIAMGLDTRSESYVDLYRWVDSDEADLNARFAATLYLFENLRFGDQEFTDLIVGFWSGDPMRVSDLRSKLREAGAASAYQLSSIKERDLALQRFRFVSRLFKAAGYSGWVLLVDEVELIGRYTVLQRSKSYAELTRFIRGIEEDPMAPITSVLAITDDFDGAVLGAKGDLEEIPNRLRAKQTASDDILAGQAEEGMRIISREMVRLEPPSKEELERTYDRLRIIHGEAYGWEPPDVAGIEHLPTNRMRQYVRAWINEWDLVRLDPEYTPDIEVLEVELGYSEDKDLGVSSEETPSDDGQ
jgi:P-loop Domain of unknown function (DUF2791)